MVWGNTAVVAVRVRRVRLAFNKTRLGDCDTRTATYGHWYTLLYMYAKLSCIVCCWFSSRLSRSVSVWTEAVGLVSDV